jgi:hypothetical protein
MPVIECSCGMVMSSTASKPRNTCIRCGGVAFQVLDRHERSANGFDRSPMRLFAAGTGPTLAALVVSGTLTESNMNGCLR